MLDESTSVMLASLTPILYHNIQHYIHSSVIFSKQITRVDKNHIGLHLTATKSNSPRLEHAARQIISLDYYIRGEE